MNTIQLNFEGYWREKNKNGIHQYSGIYVVYRCIYKEVSDTVTLKEIIYIGQANNIRERIANHDKNELFNQKLQDGEELCYSCARVKESELNAVENALIFAQKPVLNQEYINNYDYDPLHVIIDGACYLMKYINFNIK